MFLLVSLVSFLSLNNSSSTFIILTLTSSLTHFTVHGNLLEVSTDNAARFLPLLRDLGGEVGTAAEFLEVLGGIVNTQSTQMLLDGGG